MDMQEILKKLRIFDLSETAVSEGLDNPKADGIHDFLTSKGMSHKGLQDGQYSRYAGGKVSAKELNAELKTAGYHAGRVWGKRVLGNTENEKTYTYTKSSKPYIENNVSIVVDDKGSVTGVSYQLRRSLDETSDALHTTVHPTDKDRSFVISKRDTKGMKGSQDPFKMHEINKKTGEKKDWGSHPSLDGAKKFAANKGFVAEYDAAMNENVDNKSSLDKLMKTYNANEDDNAHTENLVLLAKHFGSQEDKDLANKFLADLNKHGENVNSEEGYKLHTKLWARLKKAQKELAKTSSTVPANEGDTIMEKNVQETSVNITLDGDDADNFLSRLMQLSGQSADVVPAVSVDPVAVDPNAIYDQVPHSELDVPAISSDDAHYVCDDCGHDMDSCTCDSSDECAYCGNTGDECKCDQSDCGCGGACDCNSADNDMFRVLELAGAPMPETTCMECGESECMCSKTNCGCEGSCDCGGDEGNELKASYHGILDSAMEEGDYGHEVHSAGGEPIDQKTYIYQPEVDDQRLVKSAMGDNPIARSTHQVAESDSLLSKLEKEYLAFIAESEFKNDDGIDSPLTTPDREEFDKDPHAKSKAKTDGTMSPMSDIERQDVSR